MNRLQKKCFIVSAGLHLLLVIILFLGSAFLGSREKPVTLQYIDIIPIKIIEAPFVGGGNPNAKPPPPTPQLQAPTIVPPAPQPPPPEKSSPPETVKETRQLKPDTDSLEVNDSKPRRPQINTQTVVSRKRGKTNPIESSKDTSQAQARADAARAAQFQNVLQSLKDGRSSSTTIDTPGPGGEAYAGYEIVLQSIYKRYYDEALSAAGDVADSNASAEVSVTIDRSGSVASSRLVTPSGNTALDRVVRRVLTKVTYIRPFPEGSKDSQRTFTIVFDLKPKRDIG
jgi:TonB family protein